MMKRLGVCGAVLCLLLPGLAPAFAVDATFTPTDTGFNYVVSGIPGIDGVAAVADAAASASFGSAIAGQVLIGNTVEQHDINASSVIQDSFKDNLGIVMVNQDSGNLNNQANVRVLTLLGGGGSLVQGLDIFSSAVTVNNTLISTGGSREDRIVNSFGGTTGIVGANQSSGNLNQQLNVLVLGIGVSLGPEIIALGDSKLGEVIAGNSCVPASCASGNRSEVLTDSFGGFQGIAQVTQSSGDLNIVRNAMVLSFTIMDIK